MRPVPLGALINAKTEPDRPTVLRPARYVIESDAVLRAAVGYGASEKTFPPETRQLTRAQMADLWRELRDSAMVDPGHPARVGRLPDLEDFSRETEGRGGYSISFSVEGERRILAIDEADPAAADARELVAHLAELAWIRPKPGENAPAKAAQPPEAPPPTPATEPTP